MGQTKGSWTWACPPDLTLEVARVAAGLGIPKSKAMRLFVVQGLSIIDSALQAKSESLTAASLLAIRNSPTEPAPVAVDEPDEVFDFDDLHDQFEDVL